MTTRKLNYAQRMEELKNEIDTVEKFMEPKVEESMKLDELKKTRPLTKQELNRVQELIDYIHEKNVWLVKAKQTLDGFYRPVAA